MTFTLSPERSELSRQQLLQLLGELQTATGPATSIHLVPGLSPATADEMLAHASEVHEIPYNLAELVSRSTTGAAVFWGEHHKYAILPPFPIEAGRVATGYDVEPLRSLLERDLRIALILLRLGAYAIAVVRGDTLVASKVGTGLVHSRHRKGGSSQRRFERHREKQMEYFFGRVCAHARTLLEPRLEELDYLMYGGERNTVLAFRKLCHFLQAFDRRTVGSHLNIREPKQAALQAAIGQAWSSRVIRWQ